MKCKPLKLLCIILLSGSFVGQALAMDEFVLTIENHQFTPSELIIPANKKVKLKVYNQDDAVEEFHSDDLDREKIIAAKAAGVIFLGPLAPGEYSYMGEFHSETARGIIKAQ